MNLIRVHRTVYNLDQMVKFLEHTGEREEGIVDGLDPRPLFVPFRYAELFFVDGSRVELDGPQTEAFLAQVTGTDPILDLDRVDELALGHPLVHDDRDGDVIVSADVIEEDERRGME